MDEKKTPCLSILNVNIGSMFLYMDNIWVRTDRYVANCPKFGSCRFGNIEEEEFKNFLNEAKLLDMNKVQTTLKRNLINIKVKN